ncbi:MAG: signal peptidase I [Anaerolineae bacterium]|nr:signal peptidase I [Anaerolineae bacterium]
MFKQPDRKIDSEGPQPPLKQYRRFVQEILQTALMMLVVYTLLNLAVPLRIVEGSSMEPNLHDGQRLFVSRVEYMLDAPARGDIVVILNPTRPDEPDLIKRVVGLPGETISIEFGQVLVNGVPIAEPYISAPPVYSGAFTLGPDEYFVLGDNRNNSSDSFDFGPITRDMIVGRAWISYWPPQWMGIIPDQTYDVDVDTDAVAP